MTAPMESTPPSDLDDASDAACDLSVVVPIFNEADRLRQNVEPLLSWLAASRRPGELVLVDDGSTDGSGRLVRVLAAADPRVRGLLLRPNQGRGRALQAGLRTARGRVVLTTEADGSWDLGCLQGMAELVRSGRADLAVASPHRPGGGLSAVPFERAWLSRGANWLIRRLVDDELTMATGMCRAYRREVVEEILSPRAGKEFHLDVLLRARRAGLRVVEVPARLTWRVHPGAARRLGDAAHLSASALRHLGVLVDHLRLHWERRP